MMLFLLVGRALAVDCPSSVDVVEGLASAAETQFAALDSEGLGRTAGDLETALSCLAQPIPAVLAAKVHRADALAAFAAGDRTGAKEAFSAALDIEPGYQLPASVVPARHPLRSLYGEASKPAASTTPIASSSTMSGGTWLVDGLRANVRATDRPAIIQHLSASGTIDSSTLLRSVRAFTVDLVTIEAAIPALSATSRADAESLTARLARFDTVQVDCPTRTRALYDVGVAWTRVAEARGAETAFTRARDEGLDCAPDYASRADAALTSEPGQKNRAAHVKHYFDRFAFAIDGVLELGTHDQVRSTTVAIDDTLENIGTSTAQRQTFGGAYGLAAEARFAFTPLFEFGVGFSNSTVKISSDQYLICPDNVTCSSDSVSTSVSKRMNEGELFATVIPANPKWKVKPLVTAGGFVRWVPSTTALASLSAQASDKSGSPAFPNFKATPFAGALVAGGFRMRLNKLIRFDLEQAFLYLPDTIRENTDPDAPLTFGHNESHFGVRLTAKLGVGF